MAEAEGDLVVEPIDAAPPRQRPDIPWYRIVLAAAAMLGAIALLLSAAAQRRQADTVHEQVCITEAEITSGTFSANASSRSPQDIQTRLVLAMRECSSRLKDIPLPTTTVPRPGFSSP